MTQMVLSHVHSHNALFLLHFRQKSLPLPLYFTFCVFYAKNSFDLKDQIQ